jgi:tetratricopeptide (TPR) repeat protein
MTKMKKLKHESSYDSSSISILNNNPNIGKVLVYLALLATPIFFYRLWGYPSHGKFIVFQFLILILIILSIKTAKTGLRIPKSPLYMPIVLSCIVSLISLGFSVNPLKGTDLLLRYFSFYIFFLILASFIDDFIFPVKSIFVLCISCLVVSIFGIMQFIFLTKYNPKQAFYLFYGSVFGNPNYAAQFVAAIVPLFVFCIVYLRSKVIKLSIVVLSFLLTLFYLVLTFARGSWLSLLTGFLVMGFIWMYFTIYEKYGKGGVKRVWISLMVLGILAAIIGLVLISSNFSIYNINWILKRGADIETTPYGFINSRLLIWRDSLDLIKGVFPKGVGPWNFEFELPKYQNFFPNLAKYQYAHGDFIQKACEEGPVGFFIFIWLIVALFKIIIMAVKKHRGLERVLVLSILGSVSTIVAYAFIDFPFYEASPLLVFWTSAGLITGINRSKNKNRYFNIKLEPMLGLLIAGIITITFSTYLIRFAGGGYLFNEGQKSKNADKAVEYYMDSLKLWNHEYETHFMLSQAYYVMNNLVRSEDELKESLKFNPYHWNSLENLGVLYLSRYEKEKNNPDKENLLDTAYEYFVKANRINPNSSLYNLGISYYYRKDYAKAVEYFEREAKVYPDNRDAYYFAGLCYLSMKDNVKCESLLRKALELAPSNIRYLITMSDVLYKNGKYEEAYDTVLKAEKIYPDSIEVKDLKSKLVNILMQRR